MKSRNHVDYKPSTRCEHKNPIVTPISISLTSKQPQCNTFSPHIFPLSGWFKCPAAGNNCLPKTFRPLFENYT